MDSKHNLEIFKSENHRSERLPGIESSDISYTSTATLQVANRVPLTRPPRPDEPHPDYSSGSATESTGLLGRLSSENLPDGIEDSKASNRWERQDRSQISINLEDSNDAAIVGQSTDMISPSK
jgi:hypothetical protein